MPRSPAWCFWPAPPRRPPGSPSNFTAARSKKAIGPSSKASWSRRRAVSSTGWRTTIGIVACTLSARPCRVREARLSYRRLGLVAQPPPAGPEFVAQPPPALQIGQHGRGRPCHAPGEARPATWLQIELETGRKHQIPPATRPSRPCDHRRSEIWQSGAVCGRHCLARPATGDLAPDDRRPSGIRGPAALYLATVWHSPDPCPLTPKIPWSNHGNLHGLHPREHEQRLGT